MVRFGARKPPLPMRLLGGGAALALAHAAALAEERAAWGRIGL
ncbi:hypothetical protein ACFQU7_12220 [Pseudoroseomonas wenyumeiae]